MNERVNEHKQYVPKTLHRLLKVRRHANARDSGDIGVRACMFVCRYVCDSVFMPESVTLK